jgi:hypothetical protein
MSEITPVWLKKAYSREPVATNEIEFGKAI